MLAYTYTSNVYTYTNIRACISYTHRAFFFSLLLFSDVFKTLGTELQGSYMMLFVFRCTYMHIYIYMCIYIYIYMYLYVYIYICIHIYMYIFICIFDDCKWLGTELQGSYMMLFVFRYTYMYIYMYIGIHICIYIYIYIYI